MKPVRLGFIGLGHIPTRAHLPGLAPLVEAGEVTLQAFCDINEEIAKTQADNLWRTGNLHRPPRNVRQRRPRRNLPLYPANASHGRNPHCGGQRICYLCRETTNAGYGTSRSVRDRYPKRRRCLPSWLYESLLSVGGGGMSEIAGTYLATRLGAAPLQRQSDPVLD